jgi:hypothetical protein
MKPTQRDQLLKAARHDQKTRYNEFKMLLENFGFRLASMNRLHNIFSHPKVPELINVQNINGEIRPFQVKQVINLMYKYQLRAKDELTSGDPS